MEKTKNNIVMRISILRSDNAIEHRHKPAKEKLIRVIVRNYLIVIIPLFKKTSIREYEQFTACDK